MDRGRSYRLLRRAHARLVQLPIGDASAGAARRESDQPIGTQLDLRGAGERGLAGADEESPAHEARGRFGVYTTGARTRDRCRLPRRTRIRRESRASASPRGLPTAPRSAPRQLKAYLWDLTGEQARAVKECRAGVPRPRRAHHGAQRQGQRLRAAQELPPGRSRRRDARACARGDARLGSRQVTRDPLYTSPPPHRAPVARASCRQRSRS
jgi:hypothetical protein